MQQNQIKMLAYLMVAVVLPTFIFGHQIIPCPGGLPAPTGLRITGCDASPCQVNQGGAVTYSVDFIPSEKILRTS